MMLLTSQVIGELIEILVAGTAISVAAAGFTAAIRVGRKTICVGLT